MYTFKFPKAIRGTVYRKLVTSEGDILVENGHRDCIFDHRSSEPPVIQDLSARKQVLFQRPVGLDEVVQIEPEVDSVQIEVNITGELPVKETAEQIVARIKANAQKVE